MVIPRSKQRAARHLTSRISTSVSPRSSASRSVNKPGNSPFTPPSLYGSSSPQALPLLEKGGCGDAIAGAVDGAGVGSPPGLLGMDDTHVFSSPPSLLGMLDWMTTTPTTADTLIVDDTNTTPAELRSPANRSEFCVSAGKAPNRQRAVSIPRIPSLLPPIAAPLRYALMIDAITDPIMGESIAKSSTPGRSFHGEVKPVNTAAATPKVTISLMLKDTSGGAVLWACRGGGGTGASASGVGTCAVRLTGLPQFGQNRFSGLNSCPQLPQYLCGTSAILPCLFRLLSHVVGHPLDARRLASMLLLYLTSIRDSEYHANCLFSEFLCQEVAELLRNPRRRSSQKPNTTKFR